MAVYLDDTFTGTVNTLLTAHTADVGGGWTKAVASTWDNRLSGDGCLFKGGSSGVSAIYTRTTTMETADYQIDVVVNLKSLLASDAVLAYGRYVDSTNHYRVSISQAGLLAFAKVVAGVTTTFGSKTITIAGGQSHTMSLRMIGTAISVLWDGAAPTVDSGVNSITDAAFSSAGKVGIANGFSSSTAQSSSTGLQSDRLTAASDPPAGTIASTSSLTGALTVTSPGDNALAGTVASTSTLTGAITVSKPLAGTVASTSTVAGVITVAKALAGTIDSTSTLTGDLAVTVTPDLVELAGTIVSTSTLEGTLYVPPAPETQFAIHWFWEADRYSEQPEPPTQCPRCSAPVVVVDLEPICRHYRAGMTTRDGTVIEDDCPYIATLTTGPAYAQPLAGDPVL